MKGSLLKGLTGLFSNFYTRGKEYYNFRKLLELPAPDLDVDFTYALDDGSGTYNCTAVVEVSL